MKNTLRTFAFIAFALLSCQLIDAQCEPGNATTCPDPENNGEICPETLPNGVAGQAYSQQFTILAPPEYVVDSASGTTIELHHITIKNIGNMPPGLTWETNAADSVFLVGVYYCVLIHGTPTMKGTFPLDIVVDVYIPGILGSPPIYVTTITDSTSLAINVTDASGIDEYAGSPFKVLECSPNPCLSFVDLSYHLSSPGEVTLEIYDLLGTKITSFYKNAFSGENHFNVNTAPMKPGMYFYILRSENQALSGRFVKSGR